MMTYTYYKEIKIKQDSIVDLLSDKLNSFPKEKYGLVIENIRASDEYCKLKKEYNLEFKKLQTINSFIVKNFKKEVRNEYEHKIKIKR